MQGNKQRKIKKTFQPNESGNLMDLSNKSLGNVGDVPQICPACQKPMCEKGWNKYGNSVGCYACGNVFRMIVTNGKTSWEV